MGDVYDFCAYYERRKAAKAVENLFLRITENEANVAAHLKNQITEWIDENLGSVKYRRVG